jgi:hypothetical protein
MCIALLYALTLVKNTRVVCLYQVVRHLATDIDVRVKLLLHLTVSLNDRALQYGIVMLIILSQLMFEFTFECLFMMCG